MEQVKECSTCAHWKHAGECHNLASEKWAHDTREDETCSSWEINNE
jgi:hypothetical protein